LCSKRDVVPRAVRRSLSRAEVPCAFVPILISLLVEALRSGSVTISESSWAIRLAIPSAPALSFGEVVCAAQANGHRSGLPMNANLISWPLIVPLVCQAQYCRQKPDVSFTSADVKTKYKRFGSVGSFCKAVATTF